jgi:hypothetical protein
MKPNFNLASFGLSALSTTELFSLNAGGIISDNFNRNIVYAIDEARMTNDTSLFDAEFSFK